jgi:hypothetical protein
MAYATATVKAATAMEASGNVAVIPATRITTVVAASGSSAISAPIYSAIPVTWPPITITRPVTISGSIAIAGATIPASSVVAVAVTVIPRAGADKRAAYEPVWPVITIRCASVRIIPIVAVGADGTRTNARVNRTDANAHGNLGMRGSCGKKQNPQQCCIF